MKVLVIKLALAFVWLFTGLTSLIWGREIGYDVLATAEITGLLADLLLISGAALDIVIAIWVLSGYRLYVCCIAQSLTILVYTLLLSLIDPGFWLHPFGPLTKNIPMLVLIWLLAEQSRHQIASKRGVYGK